MAYRITRYPYWRRGSNLEQVMNRMLEMESEPLPSGFPLDVLESDSEYTIKASIAGFDPERIEITYDDNTLSIRGEILEENTNGEEGKYHIRERSFGSFYRGISMPGVIDPEQISAETDNGVLVIHLPKKPETQPRKIEVTPRKVIDQKK